MEKSERTVSPTETRRFLPVKVIDEFARILSFDPIQRFKADLQYLEIEDKMNKVRAGEMTADEAFGPPTSAAELYNKYIQPYWDENPHLPRKYRLPKGWQWVGDYDTQQRLGFDAPERNVSTEE